MKAIVSLVVSLQLAAFSASAQEHDHLAMLKAYLAAHSSHGPVIPQPETVNPTAAKTFNMVARSFVFAASDIFECACSVRAASRSAWVIFIFVPF